MRKLSILVLFVGIMVVGVSAQSLEIDGFEDGNADGWVEGDNYDWSVISTDASEGTYSLEINDTGDGGDFSYTGSQLYSPDSVQLEFKEVQPSDGNHDWVWDDVGNSYRMSKIGFRNGQDLHVDTNGDDDLEDTGTDYSSNQWNTIKINGIDWSTGEYDNITLNGNVVASNVPFVDSSMSGFDQIYTYTYGESDVNNGGMQMRYDEITIPESSTQPATFNVSIPQTTDDTYTEEDIPVEITVENTGDESGTKTVNLTDGSGTLFDEQSVTLNSGESQTITLTVDGTTSLASTAGTYNLDVNTEDDSTSVSHTVLSRSLTVSNGSPNNQAFDYYEAVSRGITYSWDVTPDPDGMNYTTGIGASNISSSNTTDSFTHTVSFSQTSTGSFSWSAFAEADSYAVSDSQSHSFTINDPRHQIISTSSVSTIRMNGTSEQYSYTVQYEEGEPVTVSPQDESFQCQQSDPEYTSDGLCERVGSKTVQLDTVGTEIITTQVTGDETGVSDSTSDSINVYEPNGTYDENPTGDFTVSNSEQNISFTWNSNEEDVQAFLYFNGNQISNETLSSGDSINSTVDGNLGQNTYYVEVEGQTSGDSYTFDTQSFSVVEAGLDISLDETKFGNNQPLADTPYYYSDENLDVPLNVSDGRYKLPYQSTEWSNENEAVYYGWISNQISSGQREVSDDILGDDIDGRVTDNVTVDITYSFNSLNSDGNFSVELGDTVGETTTTITFSSGNSANQITETGLFSANDLDESFFVNGLDVAVENNLDQELTIDDIELNNVEDRPTLVDGEEFRTVRIDHTLINPSDLELWFTMDGQNATAPIQTSTVRPDFMEYRGWSGSVSNQIDREGFVPTWDLQNRKDTFGIPNQTNSYNTSIVDAPQSVTRGNTTWFFFDLNDQVTTEHIVSNGTLYVQGGGDMDSVDFQYSSDVDFSNFRSTSDVDTLDTTLSFDSESNLVSDGEFVSPDQNPVIRVERDLDVLDVLEPLEDPDGNNFTLDRQISADEATQEFTFRNSHSHTIGIYTDLSLGVSGSEPIEYDAGDTVGITPTSDVAGDGGWTVRDLLRQHVEVREQLLVEDQIQRELDIDGHELERGDLTVTYRLEDQFGNYKEVERPFSIREDNFTGRFYQLFDNSFEWDSWLTGLLVFLIIVGVGFLWIDLRVSFLIGLTFAVVAMVTLLWSGFLPLEINLLIMTILAGGIATIILKVIS